MKLSSAPVENLVLKTVQCKCYLTIITIIIVIIVVVVDAGYCVTSNKNSRSLVVIDCTSLFGFCSFSTYLELNLKL